MKSKGLGQQRAARAHSPHELAWPLNRDRIIAFA